MMVITKAEYRLRSYKPDEITHLVRIEYPFDFDTYFDFEQGLTKLAEEFGGSKDGAGTDGCTRDTDWVFPTREAAHSFLDAIRRSIGETSN